MNGNLVSRLATAQRGVIRKYHGDAMPKEGTPTPYANEILFAAIELLARDGYGESGPQILERMSELLEMGAGEPS